MGSGGLLGLQGVSARRCSSFPLPQTLPPRPPSFDLAPSRLECQHRRTRDRAVSCHRWHPLRPCRRCTTTAAGSAADLSAAPWLWLALATPLHFVHRWRGSQDQRELVATSTLRVLSVLSIAPMRGHRPAAERSRASPGQHGPLIQPVSRSGSTPIPGHQPHGPGPVSADARLRTEVFARTRERTRERERHPADRRSTDHRSFDRARAW